MSILLTSVTIKDPQSPHNGTAKDVFIEKGKVSRIADSLPSSDADKKIDGKGYFLSPSWVDIGPFSGEPGNEHRETFDSLRKAALYGGYGHLAILPSTSPVIDNSSIVKSILAQNSDQSIKIWPLASLSRAMDGKELAEILDLADAGAIGFMDGEKAVRSSSFMLKALEYVKKIDRPIFHQPHNAAIVTGANVHESKLSTELGLKGWPSISETILMDRDIELLKYAQSRLNWHNLSSADAVERVQWAKRTGLNVKAGVGYLHLCYNEQELEDFNADFKLSPPLREATDQQALWDGLIQGSIDYISSGHMPWEEERKKLEFPFASFGAEGLESAFSTFLYHASVENAVELWIQKAAIAPRNILGLPEIIVQENSPADFTLFDPEEEFTFTQKEIRSLSKNNPNIGKQQKGRVIGRLSGAEFISCTKGS